MLTLRSWGRFFNACDSNPWFDFESSYKLEVITLVLLVSTSNHSGTTWQLQWLHIVNYLITTLMFLRLCSNVQRRCWRNTISIERKWCSLGSHTADSLVLISLANIPYVHLLTNIILYKTTLISLASLSLVHHTPRILCLYWIKTLSPKRA